MDPFDLNLRHLRAIPVVAAQGSVRGAAEAVGLSQPALTQGLGKIERQLRVRLFTRHADGMTATEAGLVVTERSERAFAHLAEAMRRGGRGFSRPEQLVTAAQLKAFLGLAEAGSFAGAAQTGGLTQPAIHRAVRDLEQVCGQALAERRGRVVALTSAGHKVARGVRLAATEISAAIVTVAADPEDCGQIVVGAMPLSRALILPHAIAAFFAGTPRARLDIVEGSWRDLADPLRDGVIDLMIGALRPAAPRGLEQRSLFDDQLAVIARAGHPLASRPATLDALAAHDWVVGSAGSPLRERWETLFEGRLLPTMPIECGSVMVIRGVLAATDMLSLLSPDQVALEISSGMLTTIDAPIASGERTIGITVREGWRPTAAQARFIALLEYAARATRLQKKQ